MFVIYCHFLLSCPFSGFPFFIRLLGESDDNKDINRHSNQYYSYLVHLLEGDITRKLTDPLLRSILRHLKATSKSHFRCEYNDDGNDDDDDDNEDDDDDVDDDGMMMMMICSFTLLLTCHCLAETLNMTL
jgi:hypothetical protein